MPMRDINDELSVVNVITPAVLAADSTPAALDLQGYNAAEILLSIGVGGITFDTTNKIEFVLTHSDDNSTYTNVADADVLKDGKAPTSISNGIIRSLTAAKAAADVQKLGYIGGKRYLKLLADFSGTHGTGTAISAVLVKGYPWLRPAA